MSTSDRKNNEASEGVAEPKRPRKVSAALSKPVQPDEALSAVIGSEPVPRPQVVKKIWDYIKAEGLQDANDKRMINADEKLQPVFDGKKQVSMFEMTRLVSKHLH